VSPIDTAKETAKEVVTTLTRSTRISMALVITLIGAIGGGCFAAGMLLSKVNSIDDLNIQMKRNHNEVMDEIQDLGTRITVLETRLKYNNHNNKG